MEDMLMNITFHKSTGIFHLYNNDISYLMMILPNGQIGQLYFGAAIRDREDFSHLLETCYRTNSAYYSEELNTMCLEHLKQEYPVYGTSDFREPAVEVIQENGSHLSDFQYKGYRIEHGKPHLPGLPATYTEDDSEAMTLFLVLKDPVTGLMAELLYTIFNQGGIIARSVYFVNQGTEILHLGRAMSLSLDLPDSNYQWMQFSGAWGRERYLHTRELVPGTTSIGSTRGASSHEHNPFVILKRPHTDELQGEAIGFSLVYSGNFLAQAEVDNQNITRILMGIHPDTFDWKLSPGADFQTPEAVMVYTSYGLNHLSQTFHKLYQKRLARGYWRDRPRPILINNWEATYFDFTEEKLLDIARRAKDCGVELFVLDDGWFGARRNSFAGLGDWTPNKELLPDGIAGLSAKVAALGMKFGLWFEPEMVNADSDLYRSHPDWLLKTPHRHSSLTRHQYVLDFSRNDVVEHLYQQMSDILRNAHISYIKWDMNRYITECYSALLPADRQGEVFHRYILGVYALYEKLTSEFPEVLFESCASGGSRFDPGMLYYAPQGWTSDNTDAVDRLKIQYGTSYCYPISSIGSHVSAVPNHQLFRITPLSTRANVAYFGTFGYELDLNTLTDEEQAEVRRQTAFMKKWRHLFQFGTFYRIASPFDGNITSWMVVSDDQKTAIVGWYKILNQTNAPFSRIRLLGLNPDLCYHLKDSTQSFYGDELMHAGLSTSDSMCGELMGRKPSCDFDSRLFILQAE